MQIITMSAYVIVVILFNQRHGDTSGRLVWLIFSSAPGKCFWFNRRVHFLVFFFLLSSGEDNNYTSISHNEAPSPGKCFFVVVFVLCLICFFFSRKVIYPF